MNGTAGRWSNRAAALLLTGALTGALLAAAVGSLWPRTAQAHAVLVRSEPTAESRLRRPPASIDLWFTEPLEEQLSSFELLGADGRALPLDGLRLDPSDDMHLSGLPRPLRPGFYTVVYRTLSTLDGHDWSGTFTFTVLNADSSTPSGSAFDPDLGGSSSPPEIAARWLSFAGLSAIVGGGLLLALAAPRRGSRRASRPTPWGAEVITLGRRLAFAGVPLAVVGLLLDIHAQQQQLGATLGTLLRDTRFGFFSTGQSVLLLASVGALALSAWGARRGRSDFERRSTIAAAGLAILALLTVPFVSHAAAAPGTCWAVLTHAVHLALAATLLRARRLPLAYEEELLPLVTRFAALATVAIVTLAFTGLVRTLGELPSAGALLDTDYGRWLLAKLALVAAALVLALASRRALARFASGAGTSATLGALRRALPAEAALALLVLGAVAVLGQLPNPRGAEVNVASVTIPFNSIVPANDLAVHLQVTPARAGPNELRVHAYHPDGSDPGEFGSVRVTVSNITLGEGGTTFEAEPQGSGIFTTTATISNLSPTWTVTADVRRVGEDDARAEFRVPIEAPLAADDPGPFASPAPQLSANALGAVLFAAGGAGALLLTWRSRRRLAPHARTAALGALAASGILWLSADTHGTGTPALQNPFAGDVDSVQRGAALYTTSCVGCHGAQGLGDGPDAVGLSLAPADLSLHVPLHPETDTYAFIAQGFPGTAMPGWATELSEDQIWDLVNYLRDEFDAGVLGATSAR